MIDLDNIRFQYHKYIRRKTSSFPHWRGTLVDKYPGDLVLYAEQIFANRPDFIVETGTRYGGSTAFFADMLSLTNGIKVITIDIQDWGYFRHPEAIYLIGRSSIDQDIINEVERIVENRKVMVVLDSDHNSSHVYQELVHYGKMVTSGQFLVVEDCYRSGYKPFLPMRAKKRFLRENKTFIEQKLLGDRFMFSVTRGGWLKKQ